MPKKPKEKDFYSLYAYYRKYIEKIGNTSLCRDIKRKELGLTAGAMQMAYKEMKDRSFRGTAADYITWVGMMFMITLWMERYKANPDKRPFDLMVQIMEERPVDTIVLVRDWLDLPMETFREISREVEGGSAATEDAFDAVGKAMSWLELLEDYRDEQRRYGLQKLQELGLHQVTKHYLKLQSHEGGSVASLQSQTNQPLPQTKETDTSPQTPHTTTLKTSNEIPKTKASSDAQAERSEAFSKGRHQTPVSKGRRTTRPQKRT